MNETSSPQPLKVLVVDDDELNQRMMQIILKREKHDVYIAASGNDALEAVKLQQFDFILMDLNMPDMDGLETSRKIREAEKNGRTTYIIALTASYLPEQGRELFDAGIDNYIAKPFDIEHLKQILTHGLDYRKTSAQKDVVEDEPVLNTTLGIELVGSDEEVYRDLLNGFLERFPERIALLENSLTEKDISKFKIAAHNIKGISASLGALQLSRHAEKLEGIADEGYTVNLDDAYGKFVETYHALLHRATDYLKEDIVED